MHRDEKRRLAFRLALAMGRIDVDAMLDEITQEQFDEWWAFWIIEPWDVRTAAAIISRTVADSGTVVAASTLRAEWKDEYQADIKRYFSGWNPKKKNRKVGIIRGLNDGHRQAHS